jgi:hypothetical protein
MSGKQRIGALFKQIRSFAAGAARKYDFGGDCAAYMTA